MVAESAFGISEIRERRGLEYRERDFSSELECRRGKRLCSLSVAKLEADEARVDVICDDRSLFVYDGEEFVRRADRKKRVIE